MAETVFPGTNRRFAPTIQIVGSGGTTRTGWNSLWNTWAEPYYRDWLDPAEGTKMGLYHPAFSWKKFYQGTIVPTDASDPDDPTYDWSIFDDQMAADPIASGKAKWHWMLDLEHNNCPQWAYNLNLVHQATPETRDVLDFTKQAAVNYLKGFFDAYAARYDDNVKIYSLIIDEVNSHGGVDPTAWANGRIEAFSHASIAIKKHWVIVTFNQDIIEELINDYELGVGTSDAKMFLDTCGTTNFPPAAGSDCQLPHQATMQRHNCYLASPPRRATPIWVSSASNGYKIFTAPDGWNPPSLRNPWGELLPTNKEPPANAETNVTPAIYAWYISGDPRSSNDNSGLGLAGTDPTGIIPSNFFSLTTSGTRHAGQTPADWDRALTIFGAPGTKAVPMLPNGWQSEGCGSIWVPSQNHSWEYQIGEDPINPNIIADVYIIDIEDATAAEVADLHARGRNVIGYFSAGTWENWRSDQGDFPSALKGNDVDGWDGEKWLDIREVSTLRDIMVARMEVAVSKGFDGLDPDNVDGWENTTGFAITAGHQITYNRMIASAAHELCLSVGLKNDLNQVASLETYFDFAVNEQCFENSECNLLAPFTSAGKAVFNVEYESLHCAEAAGLGFYHVKKTTALDDTREECGTVYGITLDNIADLSDIVDSLDSFSQHMTARIVFDEFVSATYYTSAVSQIGAVADVMGEILDSFYMKDYTPTTFATRVDEYVAEFGTDIIWEIGNEINGEWLNQNGQTVNDTVTKMTYAYDAVKAINGTTALTLYYNEDCWLYPYEEMFSWVDTYIPSRMLSGLDYVWVSYYEQDCNDLQPDWVNVFAALHTRFPNSALGIGECGTEVSGDKTTWLYRYYRDFPVNDFWFVGGYFWWWGWQDFVPKTNPLWTTLNNVIALGVTSLTTGSTTITPSVLTITAEISGTIEVPIDVDLVAGAMSLSPQVFSSTVLGANVSVEIATDNLLVFPRHPIQEVPELNAVCEITSGELRADGNSATMRRLPGWRLVSDDNEGGWHKI